MSDPLTVLSYHRRNTWAFALGIAFFIIAMNFISATTVLPALVLRLSGSEFVVGVASAIVSGAWLLPQLFAVGISARLPRKLPFIQRVAIIFRPLLLVIAITIWLLAPSRPILAVTVLLLGLFGFFAADAVTSVPWFDLMARGLSPRRRGRMQGIAQVIGGVAGIGIGVWVRYVLSDGSPWDFPVNYALLYAMAFGSMVFSTISMCTIHEPGPEASLVARPDNAPLPPSLGQMLRSLPRMINEDRPFLTMLIVRQLMSFVGLASAFYVLYATSEMGFAVQDLGTFISAQVAGGLAAGLVMTVVQDRWGPLVHIRLNALMSLLPPGLALIAAAAGLGPWTLPLFVLIYFSLGLYMNSTGWPFFNWIMEHTDESRRGLYIASSNTLSALAMLGPIVGGWLVNATSYATVFAVAALFGASSLIASRWLPTTRK